MKKTDQRSLTNVFEKYDGLFIYDVGLKKRYNIDHEGILFVKRRGYYLIVNHNHTYGTSTDHKYFLIYDNLFGIILATDHNIDIALKITPKYVLLP